MKNKILIAVLLMLGFLGSDLKASDWGCQCLLCLSNPGGPTEYEECKPPIHKLERHLENGGSFPGCDQAEANGYNVDQGRVDYYTCGEAYGEGWESAWKMVEVGGESGRMEQKEYCRKLEGYKIVQECKFAGRCTPRKVAQYSEAPLKRRSEPYYIQLKDPNGENMGERVWYRKKRKKKGGLF